LEGLVGGQGLAIDASVVRADASRARSVPASEAKTLADGDAPSRAAREYLAALDTTNPVGHESDWDEPPTGDSTPPKNISPTDPAARWTAAPGGPAFYAYSTNYLIDLKAGIILDVEATLAHRTEEVESTRTMIDRVEQRFDLAPTRLVGDTAYGAPPRWTGSSRRRRSSLTSPVWEKSIRNDGTFSRPDFRFGAQSNTYECPGGRHSRPPAGPRMRTRFSSELATRTAAVAP
jgi:hypothetical protein